MKALNAIAFALIFVCAPVSAQTSEVMAVDLSMLYQNFQKSGRSTLSMPEYDQEILISGIVIGVSPSLGDTAILGVGTRTYSHEVARLTSRDDEQERKLKAFKKGMKFSAICELGFSMGTDYLPLQYCVFK